MNAEFLENYIVITSQGDEYVTAKRRPNMDSVAFIGAIVVEVDRRAAYPVESASAADGTIAVKAGPFTITYTIADGSMSVEKGEDESFELFKEWVRQLIGDITVKDSENVVIDTTLTIAGAAADSKAVGDWFMTDAEANALLNIFGGGV